MKWGCWRQEKLGIESFIKHADLASPTEFFRWRGFSFLALFMGHQKADNQGNQLMFKSRSAKFGWNIQFFVEHQPIWCYTFNKMLCRLISAQRPLFN